MSEKLQRHLVQFSIAAVLVLLAGPAFVLSMPLSEYLTAVKQSRVEIAEYIAASTDLNDVAQAETANQILKKIAVRLDETNELEFKGATIPVDNGWIKKSQVSFEKEGNPLEKKLILKSVDERLESIVAKAAALEASGARETTKDEEKQKLSNILKREEFNSAESQTESLAARVYRLVAEWLRSLFPDIEPVAPQNSSNLGMLRGLLQILILGVVAVLLFYVLIKFGPRLLKKAGSGERGEKSQIILGEEIRSGATTEDLFAEAEKLARSGDIRGAIRKGYISLLFELSQRKLIGLAKYKTNRDYLRDLKKDRQLRNDVNGLTLNYERHWYGRKSAQATEWEEFKQDYEKALKRV